MQIKMHDSREKDLQRENETWFAAVHEIGHASVLPVAYFPHVSFKNPCDLCPKDEGKAYSLAHVGHSSDTPLEPVEEILYSLAGGAAEVACDLRPKQVQLPYGKFPQSMCKDLRDLKAEMWRIGVPWKVLVPALSPAFDLICSFFQPRRGEFIRMAKRLISEKELRAAQNSLTLPQRKELFDQLVDMFDAK
jgi:hypothetical protein